MAMGFPGLGQEVNLCRELGLPDATVMDIDKD